MGLRIPNDQPQNGYKFVLECGDIIVYSDPSEGLVLGTKLVVE